MPGLSVFYVIIEKEQPRNKLSWPENRYALVRIG